MRTLLGLIAPVHVAHVCVFVWAEPGADATWRHQIILAHTMSALLGAALLVVTWLPRTRDTPLVVRGVPLFLGVYYLALGAVVAAIDQRVTSAVHPFLEATIGVGIALRLSRREIVALFTLDFLVFAVGMVLCQHDPALRVSLLVNGLTASALGAGLCLGFGAAQARDFGQRRVIERLAQELATKNMQLSESLVALRTVNVGLATEIAERREAQEELTLQATTDALTGLSNRRHFLESAEREIVRAARDGTNLVVATFDADHFKTINDSYGHDVGDQALRAIADCARAAVRRGDLLGRLGGEEFAILFVGADLEGATPVVERLRRTMEGRSIGVGDRQLRVSVSIGFTPVMPDEDDPLRTALQRADQALYAAKRAGRNKAFSQAPFRVGQIAVTPTASGES
jgi:diguanylate cyclase (GGDEF)-like protein